MIDDLFGALHPVLEAVDLELVDVELRSGILRVTVDRPGGVDLEALTRADRAVSAVLDVEDPVPGRYTLEVSSPGVERDLRRPEHFTRAIGETVTVKTRPQVPGERRLRGELVAADAEGLELAPEEGARIRLAYSDIDRARTVFSWGPGPKPGGKGKGKGAGAPAVAGRGRGTGSQTGTGGGHRAGAGGASRDGAPGGAGSGMKAARQATKTHETDETDETDETKRKQVATP